MDLLPQRPVRALGALAAGLSLGACASYHPVTVPSVAERDEVQVAFTERGRESLIPVIGPGVRSVEGVVQRRAADSAVVLISAMLLLEDGTRRSGPSPLLIPWSDVARIDRRVLDKRRTRITAAVIVGGFTAIVAGVLRSTRFRGQGQTAQGPGAPD